MSYCYKKLLNNVMSRNYSERQILLVHYEENDEDILVLCFIFKRFYYFHMYQM